MFLGREMIQAPLRLDELAMERNVSKHSIHYLSQHCGLYVAVAELSGGQRQAIAVAKAVMWNSKLVILDEPTAALGVAQTRQVLDLVHRLAEKGLAVADFIICTTYLKSRTASWSCVWVSVDILERRATTQQEVVHANNRRRTKPGTGNGRSMSELQTSAPTLAENPTSVENILDLFEPCQAGRYWCVAHHSGFARHRCHFPIAERELPDTAQLCQL